MVATWLHNRAPLPLARSQGGNARRYPRQLDCRDRWHVPLGLLGKVRLDRRLRADRIFDALARSDQSLDSIAEDIGYEAASALSIAFRKRIDCPPGSFARAYADEMPAS
ncbi:helix-turn-helix domain-containing protein [Novosphingobium capsulatum]|uniref:helix-turn-helix domain-containing protein n=1 Tax=Novosphingobium capsulatum TaxID=13688 RepID=UPI001C3F6A36|nr:helix-turn-helix domain-containing protein [Novosphingobium capsulatum]